VPDLDTLRAESDELSRSMLARQVRRETGTIELTTRDEPSPGTLLLDGHEVSRDEFAALWRWVQQHYPDSFSGGYTSGDGVRTFGLPDFCAGARGPAPAGHISVRWVVWT